MAVGTYGILEHMVIDGCDVDESGDRSSDHIAELLRRVAVGDRAAFATLYDQMSARMFGLVRRVLRDPDLSEEVLQEIFLEVWNSADDYNPDRGTGRAWLLTITHRRAVDRVRAVQASQQRDIRVGIRDLAVPTDHVAEHVEASIEAANVVQAIAGLSEAQREAIVLAYFGGYTQQEIAALTGDPLGTIKTRIRDGITRLRQEMGVRA